MYICVYSGDSLRYLEGYTYNNGICIYVCRKVPEVPMPDTVCCAGCACEKADKSTEKGAASKTQ
jgi:hypothetical protein